jgi:hypothetical protein
MVSDSEAERVGVLMVMPIAQLPPSDTRGTDRRHPRVVHERSRRDRGLVACGKNLC